MLDTKVEIDKHVENCLKKIDDETERNLRCFAFAKLYFKICEYEQTRRYISTYLSVKPNSVEGLNLLGKVLEKLGKNEAALDAYKKSIDIDPKQNNLIIKVCELLAKNELDLDVSAARYYYQQAKTFDANNSVISNLRERILVAEAINSEEVVKLLLNELKERPRDVQLRIRLVRHLLQNNYVKKACHHVLEIERKNLDVFLNDVAWYRVAAQVLIKFKSEHLSNDAKNNENWEFWMLFISVLDKLSLLLLDERCTGADKECETVIFNFDQNFVLAIDAIKTCTERFLAQEFFNHYRAQLCFHLSTLLFKYAKRDIITYKDAANMALPLLFLAYHSQPGEMHLIRSNCSEELQRQIIRWHKEAAFRCSQVGHILQAASQNKLLLEKAQQYSSGSWREKLFKKLFVSRDQQMKLKTSYFITCKDLIDIDIQLPDGNELVQFDEIAQNVYPDSLHHLVWICANSVLSDFRCTTFDGLQYSVKNLKNSSAESLSILDIEAFLYCTTLTVQYHTNEAKHKIFYNSDKPSVLSAAITNQMGTAEQSKWFNAAVQAYRRDMSGSMMDLRLTLIHGIETVRCINNHGLDIKLLIILAKTFAQRAKNLEKKSEIEFNEARAELYWKTTIPILENLLKNVAVNVHCKDALFDYKSKEMNSFEIIEHIEDAKLFLGIQLMKRKDYETALKILDSLKGPYSSFYRAQIYKSMASEQIIQNRENVTSEMRSQNIILLSRARDCLYLTLDRLRDPSMDRKHPLNAQLGSEIDKVERLLGQIEPDVTNNLNDYDEVSDDSISSFHNISHRTPQSNRYRSKRHEARPSPERLDAQLRQMQMTRDSVLTQILEQNRIIVESQRTFTDEIKSFREAVTTLTSSIQEFQNIKRIMSENFKDVKDSVNQLKVSMDDLPSFLHDLKDTTQQLKKEVAELRKPKAGQLSEEELYALEEECAGGDYGLGSSPMPSYNSNNFFPGLQPRIQPNPLASGLQFPHPAMFPNLYPMYYGNLGLPQPGTLQYAQDSQITSDLGGALNSVQPSIPPSNYSQPASQLIPPSSSNWEQLQSSISTLTPFGLNTSKPTNISGHLQLNTTTVMSTSSLPTPKVNYSPQIHFTSTATTNVNVPPVNVVITCSDPLPQKTTLPNQTSSILSVTIPPEHLKGASTPKNQPHNYQIPLPASSTLNFTTTIPSIATMSQIPPLVVSTKELLSNISLPIYSAVDTCKTISPNTIGTKNVNLGLQIEKSLNSQNLNLSNVSDVSSSQDDHDPCPDFKPIVPLPDQVPSNTGEEDEIVLFQQRSKLFRYVDKEWKERGIGVLKILQNKTTNKIRLLMRRDQVHKICANHFLTSDMVINPMPNNSKAYIWAAHDFADEQTVVEKLCARFKNEDEALAFKNAFEKAVANITVTKFETPIKNRGIIENVSANKQKESLLMTPSSNSLGGFVFSGTPIFKPKDSILEKVVDNKLPFADVPKVSAPFASFNFGSFSTGMNVMTPTSTRTIRSVEAANKSNDTSVDETEPNIEFTPVIPLPELIEVKTGEENSQILFEQRANLLRFDVTNKEWKERGIGPMKLLKETTIIRLLMRREQVLKVCCNHQLLKNMRFEKMSKSPKAVTWSAKDFSEEVLVLELFAVKFATEQLADMFLESVISAQESLDENNYCAPHTVHRLSETPKENTKKVKGSEVVEKSTTESAKSPGWAEKFKPKLGSWECKNCFIVNQSKSQECVACETHKVSVSKSTPEKPKDSTVSSMPINFSFTSAKPSWGDAFKPAPGSWECSRCLIRNDGDKEICVACQNSRIGVSSGSDSSKQNLTTLMETFKKPASEAAAPRTAVTSSWGDAFKPKPGSWECKSCFVRNDSQKDVCISCSSPKEGSFTKKEPQAFDLTTSTKFNFGIPSTQAKPAAPSYSFGITTASTTNTEGTFTNTQSAFNFSLKASTSPFKFGTAVSNSESDKSTTEKPFVFLIPPVTPTKETSVEKTESPTESPKTQFVFGSPQKHTFEFTPRSPRRHSGGVADDESDGYVDEESDDIHFKPIVPLPDKIIVKTGEEGEKLLFTQRAKLFRYIDGEWKERGVGDVKILESFENGKLRVVMRRDQVLKICLNHLLTADIEYIPKDEKTWLFSALDYSEGNSYDRWQFCLRFKSAELAQNFKKTVDDALASQTTTGGVSVKPSQESDSDVEFVSETTVTKEEEEEAIRLKLPPKFMSYRRLEDCTCEICKKEDNIGLSKQPAQDTIESLLASSSCLFGTPCKPASLESTKFVFGQNPFSKTSVISTAPTSVPATSNPSSLHKSTTSNSNNILKDMLMKPSVLSNVIKSDMTVESDKKSDAFTSFSFKTAATTIPVSVFDTKSPLSSPFQTGTSIFSNPSPNTTSGSLFPISTVTSSTTITKPNTTSLTSGNLFNIPVSSSGTVNMFGGSNLFGPSAQTFLKPQPTTEKPASEQGIVLKCDTNLSFASLAASTPETNIFKTTAQTGDDIKPFSFLGAGTPVFASFTQKTENKAAIDMNAEVKAEQVEGEKEGDEDYDPHYEPIVPMPEAVEVKTGEEDEEIIFNERAKLFRYDNENKDWKERGVGQLKILHHPIKNTYRVILRREQVHKIVLNMLITQTIELQTMKTSDRAWLWCGFNHIEGEPVLEKLAARFKNCEIAKQFYDQMQKCLQEIQLQQEAKNLPTTIADAASGVSVHSVDDGEEYDDDEEDDEGEEEEEEDERTIMCSKACILSEMASNGQWVDVGSGNIQMYYDPEIYGARISVHDDIGTSMSITTIGMNTEMTLTDDYCIWSAIEWAQSEPGLRQLKAKFLDTQSAEEFHCNYLEALQYAQECDLVDSLALEQEDSD